MDALDAQRTIIDGLEHALGGAGHTVRRFETHISWVLVTRQFAYKIKKALRLPYLNFSTLEFRRYYCNEEFRLNSRLAAELYIDVVAVTGSPDRPRIGGAGIVLEYAVRMHAFEQEALWSYRVAHDLLARPEIDALGLQLASFHAAAASAPRASAWGRPRTIAGNFGDTLIELAALASTPTARRQLAALCQWEARQRARHMADFGHRRAAGRVRECHGDLHCANVLTLDGRVQIFDCIEFNAGLRWIDVIDDLAFIHMDLARWRRPDLAAAMLSAYLESSGDYAGLAVLPYYRVYRALVRAKVALLRARQPVLPAGAGAASERDAAGYLGAAIQGARPGRAAVMITHGYAGSGKSTFARHVVAQLGAIQLRSDVERKRLHGMPASARQSVPGREDLYGATASRRTYARLHTLARTVVHAGWPVIVDAAFLTSAQRASFRALASSLGVPFFVFDISADRSSLIERVRLREQAGLDASDANVAVLEHQFHAAEALADSERAIVVETEHGISPALVRDACDPVFAALDIA